MKRLLAIFSLLLALPATGATISGTVSSGVGPLAGMTVAAYTTGGTLQSSGATTSSGTYALTVPAGSYHMLAFDPAGAYATSFYADAESFETSSTLTLTTSTTLANINFVLVRAGFIVGRARSNGSPLASITVAAYNPSGTRRGFTTTDATGSYTLALPQGSYEVAAYDDALRYATVVEASAVPVVTSQTQIVNFDLPLAAKIAGSITDRLTGAALGNMRLTVYASDGTIAAQAITGSDGRFAFAVRPDSVRLVVDDPAGAYASAYVPDAEAFSVAPRFTAAAGQTLTVNASVVRAGRLAGRVTDRTTGAPIASIVTVAYNLDGTTRAFSTTDAGGAYSIVVPPGDYRIGVYDASLVYVTQFYGTLAHAIAEQTTGGFDFALVRGATVTGRVTSSGNNLNAITVAAYDLSGQLLSSTSTDATGRYALLVAPGIAKLLAFDPALHYATAYYLGARTFAASPVVSLVEGQSYAADFSMTAAGRIIGSVVDAISGAPLDAMDVIAYDGSDAVAQTLSDALGSFRIAVPPGTYIVAAADPAHRYGNSTAAGTSIVGVGQDFGPLQIRLARALLARHHAVRH